MTKLSSRDNLRILSVVHRFIDSSTRSPLFTNITIHSTLYPSLHTLSIHSTLSPFTPHCMYLLHTPNSLSILSSLPPLSPHSPHLPCTLFTPSTLCALTPHSPPYFLTLFTFYSCYSIPTPSSLSPPTYALPILIRY